MFFTRRCDKKLRILSILIFLLIIFLLSFLNPNSSFSSNGIQPLKLINKSSLFHINGTIKHLGKAHSIYIINLPSRSDRRTYSIALIQTFNLEAFLFPAYSIDSSEILTRYHYHNFFFKLSELACWASHMRVWMTIVNESSNNSWSIIFEDDIDLEMDTINIMESFPNSIWNNADLIYLGHCANPPGRIIYQTTKHIYRIHQALHPSCTHAYAIRSNVARRFIYLLSKPSRPIDNLIVKLVNKNEINVYSIHPPLAIQKPVSKLNPSDVNRINRQSLIYYIQLWIYEFLQWWNGVQSYEKLNQSALEKANLTKAIYWRKIFEKGIWKNKV